MLDKDLDSYHSRGYENANYMFMNWQGRYFHGIASIFNNEQLNYNCSYNNENKEWINTKSIKHIYFFPFKLSGIDFIKYLHEHKNIKEHSKMFSILNCPNIIMYTAWNSKDFCSLKQNYGHYNDLVSSLANYISPHEWCYKTFSSTVRLSL